MSAHLYVFLNKPTPENKHVSIWNTKQPIGFNCFFLKIFVKCLNSTGHFPIYTKMHTA